MSRWIALTDEDREAAFNSLDDGLNGFLKKWGWLHFAKAIEDRCREKNEANSACENCHPSVASEYRCKDCPDGEPQATDMRGSQL